MKQDSFKGLSLSAQTACDPPAVLRHSGDFRPGSSSTVEDPDRQLWATIQCYRTNSRSQRGTSRQHRSGALSDIFAERFGGGTRSRGAWAIGRSLHALGGVISTPHDLLRYGAVSYGRRRSALVVGYAAAHARDRTDEAWDGRRDGHYLKRDDRRGRPPPFTWRRRAGPGQQPDPGPRAQICASSRVQRRAQFEPERRSGRIEAVSWRRQPRSDTVIGATGPPVYVGRYSRPFADVIVTAENGAMLVQVIRKRDGIGGRVHAAVIRSLRIPSRTPSQQ